MENNDEVRRDIMRIINEGIDRNQRYQEAMQAEQQRLFRLYVWTMLGVVFLAGLILWLWA